MERTHKPTGHIWSCPSRFQQSVRYRELQSEDFLTPFGKVIVPGADDDLTKSERSAKRRKVEGLAQGFLGGRTLVISSAAANGMDLRETVKYALKTQGLTWDDFVADEGVIRHDLGALADGTNIKRHDGRRVAISGDSDCKIAGVAHANRPTKAATQIGPTQARGPVSTTPSVEALAHAAQLRAKKLRSDTRPPTSQQAQAPSNIMYRSHSDVAAQPSSSLARQPLSQRDNVKPLVDSSLADELRLSYVDTPSRKPRRRSSGTVALSEGGSNMDSLVLAPADITARTDSPKPTIVPHHAHDDDLAVDLRVPSTASDMASTAMTMCTAFRASTAADKVHPHPLTMPSASGQETTLALESALDEVRVDPPSKWTPINAPSPETCAATHFTIADAPDTAVNPNPTTGECEKTAAPSFVSSERVSRRSNVARAAEGASRAKLKGDENSMLKLFKQAKPGYQSAPLSQGGTTPLMYKKRGRPKQVPSPETNMHANKSVVNEGMLGVNASPSAPAPLTEHTPLLDMSFGDDSFAPKLNMALVDEHLNKRLPRTPNEKLQRSSLKSAMRKQMRDSGATLERASSEPPSSQLDTQDKVLPRNEVAVQTFPTLRHVMPEGRRTTAFWPGTQYLLNQAQHDLFTSPDKSDRMAEVGISTGMQPTAELCTLELPVDKHDAAISQQNQTPAGLPATQMLMDGWQGWSTVKPAGATKMSASADSPLLAKAGVDTRRSRTRKTRSSLGVELQQDRPAQLDASRSSAKPSTASTGSFAPLTTSGLRVSMTDSELLADTTVRLASTAPPTTSATAGLHSYRTPGDNLQDASFAASAPQADCEDTGSMSLHFSSFMRTDESKHVDAEDTLADLAKTFLSTADVDVALSQV
ncbi:hypothetical protein B0A48_09808 [Cryoendolithus antarcticus]|uniref:Uncharacterized protein n=1 Tax=Cryoendolithus antarcticus TaxID=1507870 RepID=A0A1V8T2S3_9PEZI|nr:hypothetical protein B0A48_09808 [Cryoendolithus antarcticus]